MNYKKNITPVDFLEQEDEPEESFYSNEDMKKYFDEKYKFEEQSNSFQIIIGISDTLLNTDI